MQGDTDVYRSSIKDMDVLAHDIGCYEMFMLKLYYNHAD